MSEQRLPPFLELWNRARMYDFVDALSPKYIEEKMYFVTEREFDKGFNMPQFPQYHKPAMGILTLTCEGYGTFKYAVPPNVYQQVGVTSTFRVRILVKKFSRDIVSIEPETIRPPLVVMN